MIKVLVNSKEEFEWMHEVISTGTINVSTEAVTRMVNKGIQLNQEVKFSVISESEMDEIRELLIKNEKSGKRSIRKSLLDIFKRNKKEENKNGK